tara:strand:- start:732370 stop:733629 length:1260 start_codon:yes stop_codon:yes gene_type:complete
LNAEIITIGDEILIGQITDTNSKFIAEALNKIGVSVYQITSVQDDKTQILKTLAEAEENADIIILTGGLGPTKDDITKYTIAEYFQSELSLNKEIEAHIKAMFAKVNYKFTELNRQQAVLPDKALVLKNNYGTASGMWFHKKGKVFISLPGVPNEMKGLITQMVIPKLQESFALPTIIHRTILTYGMGESMVAERLEDWENNLPEDIKLAYLPNYGKLRLRLTAKGKDKAHLEKSLQNEIAKLTSIIGDIIVGYDENENLEAAIGNLLQLNKQTLSVAESCTGGAISKMITSVPGASNYFIGGVVSYSAQVKTEFLEVPKDLVVAHSVVSAEVGKSMALAVQKKFKTDYAIGITGNAGPTQDETDESVGEVFIAIASPEGVFVENYNFGKPREKVIERASVKALELLKSSILKKSKNSL